MTAARKGSEGATGWLLFFYTVPSRPVGSRMKVWRKLVKAGAVPLKGAVYILPSNEEHEELLQWLVAEVTAMQGEAAFVKIQKIETMRNEEVVALFNRQRAEEYAAAAKALDPIERRLSSIRKGSKAEHIKALAEQFGRIRRDAEEVRRVDFYAAPEGMSLTARIRRVQAELDGLAGAQPAKGQPVAVAFRKIEAYQGKRWVTRKRPFIDRMASAWLIRRFIDAQASFDFIDEGETLPADGSSVVFDMSGGEFTHAGDLCTFEVLIKAFQLRDKTLRKVAEMVHNLDMKDDRYPSADAKGIEDIVTGIRKTARDDREALEKGMAVFELLYASKG